MVLLSAGDDVSRAHPMPLPCSMAPEKKARVTGDVMQLLADKVITPYSGGWLSGWLPLASGTLAWSRHVPRRPCLHTCQLPAL